MLFHAEMNGLIQPLLTGVTVLSFPAGLAEAGSVMALAVFLAARMARSLVARRANPALLTLAPAL